MSFYQNANPNLIGPIIKKKIHDILKYSPPPTTPNNNNIHNSIINFYNTYVKHRIISIIIILLIISFLVFRYYSHKSKKHTVIHKEQFSNADFTDSQIKSLLYSDQPHVNPSQSIHSPNNSSPHIQQIHPPTSISANLGDDKYVTINNKPSLPFDNFNTPIYDYNNVHYLPSEYYHGTLNTYENAQDTSIINPLGYDNAFNTSTGNFVNYSTSLNNSNLDTLANK